MKTFLKVSAIVAASTLSIGAFASAEQHLTHAMNNTAQVPATKPNMSKVSYMIGYQIGEGFKIQHMGVNSADFLKGFNASTAGQSSMYGKSQTKKTMQQFQMYMMSQMAKKQARLSGSNASKSEAFMNKVAKQSGVKKLANGVYYRVLKTGTGPMPTAQDTVKVNYVGSLSDGKVFDSSYKRHEPLTIGVSQVIPGWTKALEKMPVGSTWMLYIAPNQAYGKFAPPSIGPNQALVFKVNLLSIEKHGKS